MKINENIAIWGSKTVLIPYEKEHVPKYSQWMKSPELRFLTGSESLTLEEEYQMQKSWRDDEDKLTFLILDRTGYESSGDEIESLVGDTNLFLNVLPPSEEDNDEGEKVAEIEIMIAEQRARKKGFGWEAVITMLLYGINSLNITLFTAKIGLDNISSIKLFEKLGFTEVCKSEIFQEITLKRKVDSTFTDFLFLQLNSKELNVKSYRQ